MNKTKIEWCDSTWNPVTGCLHGCEYCYARKIANRFGAIDKVIESAAEEGINLSRAYFSNPDYFSELNEPVRDGNGKIKPYPYNFYPTLHAYRLDVPQKWTEPRTIFVGSMTDLFGEWVPDKWIKAVFDACAKAPQHRYLFLTKNPKRYIELADKEQLPRSDNMWYGSTVTSMENYFSSEKSFNTFLSIEPLLTSISPLTINSVKWIIIGAETGNRKDKVVPEKAWIDNIMSDCNYNDIPVFMKDSLIPIIGEENMRREFPWQNKFN